MLTGAATVLAPGAAAGKLRPTSTQTPIIWYQAFERPSAEAACVAPADETPWQDSYLGQKTWTPSWAQWANGGKGGPVCERWIQWTTQVTTTEMPG